MGRNDLSASIGTTAKGFPLNVNFEAKSGYPSNVNITNPLDGEPGQPATGSISIQAAGEGSNLFLYITCNQYVWGIILGCPANKENYFEYVYYGWPKAEQDTYNAADDSQKYYASNGAVTFTPTTQSSAPGTQVTISITNDSPATGLIRFANF
jgi:hypothetical protein